MSSVPSCRQRKPLNHGISWICALSKNWIVPDSSTGYTSRNGFSRGPERLVSQKFLYPLVYLFRLAIASFIRASSSSAVEGSTSILLFFGLSQKLRVLH